MHQLHKSNCKQTNIFEEITELNESFEIFLEDLKNPKTCRLSELFLFVKISSKEIKTNPRIPPRHLLYHHHLTISISDNHVLLFTTTHTTSHFQLLNSTCSCNKCKNPWLLMEQVGSTHLYCLPLYNLILSSSWC